MNPEHHANTSHSSNNRAALADSDDDASPGGAYDARSPSGTRVVEGDVARAPTLVHRPVRVQSTQGILNQFGEGLPSSAVGYDDTEDTEDGTSVASSPNLTESSPVTDRTSGTTFGPSFGTSFGLQHARQGSRGSARLLDIPARKDSVRSSLQDLTPSNRSSGMLLEGASVNESHELDMSSMKSLTG